MTGGLNFFYSAPFLLYCSAFKKGELLRLPIGEAADSYAEITVL